MNPPSTHYGDKFIYKGETAQQLIHERISRQEPCLAGRFGETELRTLWWFMEFCDNDNVGYNRHIHKSMRNNAGFINPDDASLTRFCCELLQIAKTIDILGVWFIHNEKKIAKEILPQNALLVDAANISPCMFAAEYPWTRVLSGKKVLVIHPFAESIRSQYKKRELLFENQDILPEFDLLTLTAYQSIGGNNPDNYPSWFAARDAMKLAIDKIDFDIALVAAGAYGLFLAHHCKLIGKKAVHMAGGSQLLFGIQGKRWEHVDTIPVNEHWVRPKDEEIPQNHKQIEDGCYW